MTDPVRRAAVIVMRVAGPPEIGGGYEPGPLALPLPGRGLADADARRTYFSPRAADALYGDHCVPHADGRWHRELPPGVVMDAEVTAVELLRMPSYACVTGAASRPGQLGYLAVFHLVLPVDAAIDALGRWVNLAPETAGGRATRQAVTDLVGPGFDVPPSWRRAFSITLLTFGGPLRNLTGEGAPSSWDASSQWLWWAATATSFRQFPPDPEDTAARSGLIRLSASWRALVVRDGMAFVSLTGDHGGADPFFPSAEIYVRSIYTDVVLLALLQREGLEAFADTLATIGSRSTQADRLRLFMDDLTEFRNMLWWESVTLHGIANQLLQRLHDAHRTVSLFDRVVNDVQSFAAQTENRVALKLGAVQEENRRLADRLTRIGVIVAIGFGFPAVTVTALGSPIKGITNEKNSLNLLTVLIVGFIAAVLGLLVGWTVTVAMSRRHRRRYRSDP